MYKHGFTTSGNILKDLATVFTTGDDLVAENNLTLVNPDPTEQIGDTDAEKLTAAIESIADTFTVKMQPKMTQRWVKRELKTVGVDGVITLTNSVVAGGNVRVYVRDKKYYLYRAQEAETLDVMEYKVSGASTIQTNVVLANKEVLVDYEKPDEIVSTYYIRVEKPQYRTGVIVNHHFVTWTIGESYDAGLDSFPADHESKTGKISWFRETDNSVAIAKDWLPIEYWISGDRNAITGVVMGDPGLSASDWLSSPFYFGLLEQIEGALETDIGGNFAGYGGSATEPVLTKDYGDYTATGVTDVVMVATKTGRPYQAHKVQIFGGYEFREKTFNAQSAHTGKHAVSDIILADVHENDRGIMRHCLAVPRVAKTHACELIYNRYVSGEEERYIFLNINAPFTPFNTSSDCLIGIAIRTDI